LPESGTRPRWLTCPSARPRQDCQPHRGARRELHTHHAFLAGQALQHIDSIDGRVAAFDQQIDAELHLFAAQHDRLITIPGVSHRVAQIIIAETGADMSRFATAAALAC
jgi:transposase